MTVPSRDERNTISDEYRNDANDELVDRLRIEKRGDDVTATHQPDILARCDVDDDFSRGRHDDPFLRYAIRRLNASLYPLCEPRYRLADATGHRQPRSWITMQRLLVSLALLASVSISVAAHAQEPRVLVFSKTAGYRHSSIASGIAAIKKLGQENGFAVDAT